MNRFELDTDSLTRLHWAGIGLAAVTGVIHLAVGLPGIATPLGAALVLAALGFFGAIALVLVGWRRRLVYAVGLPFVGAQIVLWFVLNGFPLDAIEAVDKAAQLLLLGVLVGLLRR